MSKKPRISKFIPARKPAPEQWFVINNSVGEVVAEKRLITGISITETINVRNQIFDYDSSKPYMLQYIADAEKRTGGASKGAVRTMHNGSLVPVGIITDITFDDAKKIIYTTVYIQDDDAWEKVLAHVYTSFSWGGRSVGPTWVDEVKSAELGVQAVRYTFRPTELSLVDVPAVPDTCFTNIENSDKGDDTMKIENGTYTSNELQTMFANIAQLIEYISVEEIGEGQDQSIPDALREGLLALKPAVKSYVEAQLDEVLPDNPPAPPAVPSDYDVLDDEAVEAPAVMNAADAAPAGEPCDEADKAPVKNEDAPAADAPADDAPADAEAPADKPAPSDASKASLDAHKATVQAHVSGSADDHAKAAAAHEDAAKAHEDAGHKKMAAHHTAQAAYHKGVADAAPADGEDAPAADAPADANDVKNAADNVAPAGSKDVTIELSAGIAEMLKRLDALEAKISTPITNSASPATFVMGNTKVVTREMDAGMDIQNGASDIEAEARRIADLPMDRRAAALIARQLATRSH